MSIPGRREVLPQGEIHERISELTREIQHAKIECDADKSKKHSGSKNPDDENGEKKLLKDLELLKITLCEYMLSIRERQMMRRGSLGSDRDSGISLDRSSVLSRDSYPIQERGDAVESVLPLRSLSVNSPIENNETDEDEKKPAMFTNDDYPTSRRTTRERRHIITDSFFEDKKS